MVVSISSSLGGIHLPEALSGRMLIGFWWLFVIVTVTTYSGNLVAFLTFPKIQSPVNTVEDLTHHRGVESFGFLAGSIIEDHLKVFMPKMTQLFQKNLRIFQNFSEITRPRISSFIQEGDKTSSLQSVRAGHGQSSRTRLHRLENYIANCDEGCCTIYRTMRIHHG